MMGHSGLDTCFMLVLQIYFSIRWPYVLGHGIAIQGGTLSPIRNGFRLPQSVW